MKNILVIIGAGLTAFILSCGKPKVLAPSVYHDQIITIYNNIDSAMVAFIYEVYDTAVDVETLTKDHEKLLNYLKHQDSKLNTYEEIPDDPGFLKEVKNFSNTSINLCKNNYKTIVDLYNLKVLSDSKLDRIKSMLLNVAGKLSTKEQKVLEMEKLFADKNYLKLPETSDTLVSSPLGR